MGQTLTHGIYLPDEGERNCYSGLAANWQILDGSVGTIAAHTTALASKAPAVHTHTKADITDFPVYGTTAGTICEGNDSRLSDARTPVAHTHTKSDVTDLLNSNFIPSANNSYDLGSSSYQWNNLYAKNYYYNGTEFQNKFVTTDTIQTINASKTINSAFPYLYIKNPNKEKGVAPSDRQWGRLNFTDKNNAIIAGMEHSIYSNGASQLAISINNLYSNGTLNPSGTSKSCAITLELSSSGEKTIISGANASTNLGTSTNKWKTLNGVNPGALSLPSGYTEEGADKHYINIASVIQTLDGTLYNYTMPDNGWISVRAEQANQVHATTDNWKFGQSFYSGAATTLIVSVPFKKGDIVAIKVRAVTLEYARFYPMQGNV